MTTDDTSERDSAPDRHPLISVGMDGFVKVWTLPDHGVIASVMAGDGATITMVLRNGEMGWTLNYETLKWQQSVVYRQSSAGEHAPTAVAANGVVSPPTQVVAKPLVEVRRPSGRLQPRRKSGVLTMDQATGAV